MRNYYGGGEKRVIVEVAPHHGNAFSGELSNVKPRIAYIPRCDEHTRWSISTSYAQSAVTRANHSLHHTSILTRLSTGEIPQPPIEAKPKL
ncbi:hypothetical protein [Pyrobaculum islandicum]|uniref:hypothetical protein n=1 Tax=Pyrobaculum islandicum TaxID=2277 RepID=UPI00069F2EAE|nr:hypothetical protein [Pyrobaculum islandicum]